VKDDGRRSLSRIIPHGLGADKTILHNVDAADAVGAWTMIAQVGLATSTRGIGIIDPNHKQVDLRRGHRTARM